MIKFLILLLIIVLSGLIGFVVSNYYKNRVTLYYELIKMITNFKSEIFFLQTNFKTLLERQTYGKYVNMVLQNYLKNGQASIALLKSKETQELTMCLNSIGKSDVDGEIKNLNYYDGVFNEKYLETKNFYDKYGSLIIKLSIIAGALIAVILM